MPDGVIDFDGSAQQNPNGGSASEGIVSNNNPANQVDSTALGGDPDVADVNANQNVNPDPKDPDKTNDEPDTIPHDIEVGTTIEFDGVEYKVSENGDVVDADGKVFKQAKDVKAWLDENIQTEDDDAEISIDSLKQAIGIDITDDKGNAVEFSNNIQGVKAYVDSVINIKSDEIRQGAINKLYSDNPLLKQFVDYVTITGTPRGFGELPDRSGIELDQENEAQLESIIRMAAAEFGNKSLNENYIKYLKSTGGLYDEAKAQLEALQVKDAETRKNIELQAKAAREKERKKVEDYFGKVSAMISSRKIGKYTLPENIVKERNGQKVTLTLNDFYNYIAKSTEVDEQGNGLTGYQRDLNNQSDDEVLAKDLLDAWLVFTGGSYQDLVNMIANEDNVRRLVVKSKENKNKHQVRVVKPTKSKSNIEDIIF